MASNATSLLTQGIIAQAAIAKNQPITKTGTVANAGGTCIGFSQTSAAIGERFSVTVLGSGIGVAGGTIAANAALQVGANGTVITQSTGAIIGRAMNAAVLGDHVEVFIAPHGNVSSGENPVTGGLIYSGGEITLPGSYLARSAIASSITDSAGQGTTESTLQSLVIPANTLGVNDGLEISILYSCTNTAASKRIRGRFGGTVLWNFDLTTHLTFRQNFIFRNRNSQSSQILQANSTTIFSPIGSVGVQTATVDFSAEQTLTLTGQFPVAGTGANSIAIEQFSVKVI